MIAGAQDPATPPEHAERIAAAIPDARLEVLDPGAHLVNVERPEAVTELILDHLEGRWRTRYEAGMKVRREVLGDEHVDRATDNATDFTRPFQEYITRSAWGEAWTRPGPGPQDALVHHARDPDRAAGRERDPDARPRRGPQRPHAPRRSSRC